MIFIPFTIIWLLALYAFKPSKCHFKPLGYWKTIWGHLPRTNEPLSVLLLLTYWGRDKMAVNFQTTYSKPFSSMKNVVFWLKFHWNLLDQGPIDNIPALVQHWNGNVFILMKFSSLAALKVVKMTTSSAASDENFIKMTFSFQWDNGLAPVNDGQV